VLCCALFSWNVGKRECVKILTEHRTNVLSLLATDMLVTADTSAMDSADGHAHGAGRVRGQSMSSRSHSSSNAAGGANHLVPALKRYQILISGDISGDVKM
jgi:hypothetical protein